ncbi:hypothetical protein [Stackebrandtia nassauensis]|uniref:Uncharacterized protein n=1 Tax=Stackebrandtia nassauensis (strain DSM 44728 / CIP 108903 / NRRL B-16338 / NBRC 102104 / LLR-40K-21) TaxID=446470 RepID=D3Q4L7_STANL|nr:hypothetical protein [Stackebrandtia nassauensis]ADD40177.1 hypothetical protein Snas_0462 [Stackebrandtia nassauensis DSM 44728]
MTGSFRRPRTDPRLRECFDDLAPGADIAVRQIHAATANPTFHVADSVIESTRLGWAVEFTIGIDLAPATPYEALIRAHTFDRATTTAPSTRRPRNNPQPLTAASSHDIHVSPEDMRLTYCWDLAKHRQWIQQQLQYRPAVSIRSDSRWNSTAVERYPDALAKLSDAYHHHGRQQFQAIPGQIQVAPVLTEDYAIADLIIGSTLIDIKTSRHPAHHARDWISQTLHYAFLAPANSITHIGIYLARHAKLIIWPLTLILGTTDSRLIHYFRNRYLEILQQTDKPAT